jgi:DNA-directed RNA polymerase subunit RPC12/RpoP
MRCQNCGQDNDFGANFCRFCGTRIVLNQQTNQTQNDSNTFNSPRPYMWKTDEFQVSDARQTQHIQQVQPIPNQTKTLQNQQQPIVYPQQNNYQQPANLAYQPPQPLMQQQQQYAVPFGYRCPRCGSQNSPQFVRKISTAGWIVFAVLLVTFFPLFWIGFLIKEDVRVCPICTTRIG